MCQVAASLSAGLRLAGGIEEFIKHINRAKEPEHGVFRVLVVDDNPYDQRLAATHQPPQPSREVHPDADETDVNCEVGPIVPGAVPD